MQTRAIQRNDTDSGLLGARHTENAWPTILLTNLNRAREHIYEYKYKTVPSSMSRPHSQQCRIQNLWLQNLVIDHPQTRM